MNMMLRQLEYLVALANEGHFARAAEECAVSQPALSEGIRKLEKELGAPLVRRGHAFQGLTVEGETVLKWARKILKDHASLRQEISHYENGLNGTLRLGTVPAASSTVATLTDKFARAHPQVGINVQASLHSADIVRQIRNYELDAGLIYAEPQDLAGLLVYPLYAEEHVLLTAPGMLPEGATTAWATALELPLCLLDSSLRGRQVLDQTLSRHDLVVSPRIECDSIVTLLAHVSTGNWASIVPRQWLPPLGALPGIELYRLDDPQVTSQISLVMEDSSPLTLMSQALEKIISSTFPAVDMHLSRNHK
ncbi:DNA-binding transcriptional LysR family regulator [Arthrobacter sp. JUb119]|uniref:LysR family transcriptional regulator n=1 Tax=Actinomycetes TaxID=1760 RepID=UPI000F9769BF|nr:MULTISPECIES: LysR family transcriptional regulator [unclassified Arthrobacter]MCS3493172.1 DNA-binding transcriptional LysR family regulator [Arthrobacter sp. JUb119]TDU21798.1 DNA-binding transcriptional LysR family regulator [Arthrobacter sp. JUb115]